MKKIIPLVSLILLFMFVGCNKTQTTKSLEPKQVIEKYFEYSNKQDKQKVLSTLTEWHNDPNVELGIDNIKSIKINKIAEESDTKQRDAYIKYGRGKQSGYKEDNVLVYKVDYDVKYKEDNLETSGKHIKWFTLVRKDENSAWLIDEIGEG
jgi:hypothetical protein